MSATHPWPAVQRPHDGSSVAGQSSWWAMVVWAIALVGCTPHPASKIVGTWVPSAPSAVGELLDRSDLQVEFVKDGRFVISMRVPVLGHVSKQGTWKFHSVDGTNIVVEIKLAEESKSQLLHLNMIGDDMLEFVPPGVPTKPKLRFTRKVAS